MIAATRWRQDSHLDPTQPWQRVRFRPTFPSGGGGFSAFGWTPQPLDGAIQPYGHSIMPNGGLSGLGVGIPSFGTIAKVTGAVVGIAAGAWLARKNLG